MSSRLLGGAAVAVALVFAVALPAFAHSGEEESAITAEPSQVTAGGTVVLAGSGLEPDSDRQINLVGPDVIVPFGTARTDAEGMFSVTLTIPGHLPPGTYTFQAIGDETLTAGLAVSAAGGAAAEPGSEAADVVAPRSRSGLEVGVLAVVIVLSIGIGLVLVAGAERVGRPPERTAAPSSSGRAVEP